MRARRHALLAAVLCGFGAAALAAPKPVPLVTATTPRPEAMLLDVHIAVFSEADDFISEVRLAEARYVSVRLRETLQQSGHWGAARVVPRADVSDLNVTGDVVASSGRELRLRVRARDARGKVWLKKTYKRKADASAYLSGERDEDAFQDIYHRIANDLYGKLRKLDQEDIEDIRELARLRSATDLAPEVFDGYVAVKKKTRYAIARLPARDDPMFQRAERILGRHAMFIDAVDRHYARLASRMTDAYRGWQSEEYWRREAMKRGPPSAVGSGGRNAPLGVLVASGGASRGDGTTCGTPGLFGGPPAAAQDQKRFEDERRRSHVEILQQLGASLAEDIGPELVEVEGRVVRLTGSLDAQYEQWRRLLRALFSEETGALPPAAAPAR